MRDAATSNGEGAIRSRLRRLFVSADAANGISPAPPLSVREIFRHFWPFARPYRRYLVLSIVLMAVAPLVVGARLYMIKVIVDEVLVPIELAPFLWIVPVIIGLSLVGGAISYFDTFLNAWIGQRFLLSLRGHVFDHLQSLSLSFFDRRKLGDVLGRLVGDVGAIEAFVVSGVATTVSSLFTITFFSVALVIVNWRMALLFFVIAPVFAVLVRVFSRLIKRAAREKSRRGGAMMAYAEESFSNIALVQAYNGQEAESQRFRDENLGAFHASMVATRLRALFTPTTDIVQAIVGLAVLAVGATVMRDGGLSLGALLLFIAYTQQLYLPMRGLARLYNVIYAASAGAERVVEVLDERPTVEDRPGARPLENSDGAIEFDDVTFTYPGSDEPALANVSFSVEPGQKVALVGHSGAGKSTIARLLLRFQDPTTGAVRIGGENLRDLQLSSLRENCALLLQETLMFDGSVRANILYGKPDASEETMIEAAKAADALEFILELPGGYDAPVGQRGRRLSGGQRQRIAIARAMIKRAPLLLLDEPTTGLDAESSHKVLDPLRRLMTGRTTVVISHTLLTVSDADLILVLDHGHIVERGTLDELLEQNGYYTRFVRLQESDANRAGGPAAAPIT